MSTEHMKITVLVTLTRGDGDHNGETTFEEELDRDDTGAAIWTGAVIASEVAIAVTHLITHRCGDEDRPVKLGDMKN